MKSRILVLAAALLGGVISTSAIAASPAGHYQVDKALGFEAPVVEKVVSPTGLTRRHAGVVNVALTIDEAGRASDIRVLTHDSKSLTKSLVSAISRWQFAPGKRDGVPVTTHVVLPIELVEFGS